MVPLKKENEYYIIFRVLVRSEDRRRLPLQTREIFNNKFPDRELTSLSIVYTFLIPNSPYSLTLRGILVNNEPGCSLLKV